MKLLFASALLFTAIGMTAAVCIAQPDADTLTLEQQLIKEQINNQKAQAAYYQKQVASKSAWDSLASALMSAIGTFIGAGLALIGVRWSSNRQWELEQRKWIQTKKDETLKDIKLAAATLAQKVAAEIQAMIWLTWIARFEPEMFTEKDINAYDREMKSLMGEDIVAQAALAAVDPELYKSMKPFVKEASSLDHRMSSVTRRFKRTTDSASRGEVVIELGHFYGEAYGLYENLPDKLGSILGAKFGLETRA